jgi:hypothetical protein
MVTYLGGKYYGSPDGSGGSGSRGPNKQVKVTAYKSGALYPIHVVSDDSAYGWLKWD